MFQAARWVGIGIVALGVATGCTGFDSPAAQSGQPAPPAVTARDGGDGAADPGVAPSDLLGAVIEPPRALSDFVLASTEGEPFQLSAHRGQAILLYFGYRACPDFCPTTFAELRQVYMALGEPSDKLKVVFVTVDPERDTLEMLTAYAQAFHPDFIGLRDEGPALAQLMDEFGVVAERRVVGESAMSYLIDHTASLFLIGPDGHLHLQYLYGTDYQDIVHDLKLILASS